MTDEIYDSVNQVIDNLDNRLYAPLVLEDESVLEELVDDYIYQSINGHITCSFHTYCMKFIRALSLHDMMEGDIDDDI